MEQDNEKLFDNRDWLICGKFEPQTNLSPQITRSALLEKLDKSSGGLLTLIIAPAGYGKSTALSQWLRKLNGSDRTVAWLNLDDSDRVPHQFLSHLVLSLCHAGVEMGSLEKLAIQGFVDVSIDAVIRVLSATLARAGKSIVIIIDDYHRAGGGQTDSVMEKILGFALESVHFVVCTRQKPGFGFSDLKVNGLAQELHIDDLRFNVEDTCRLFPKSCARADLAILTQRTEGWVVALQLAHSILRDSASLADVINNLSGVTDDLAEYFNQQIYRDLPDNIKQVLRRTSILDCFSVDLANAVSERIDCLDILDHLKRRHSLIISVKRETIWYRYHHLLVEFLNNELERVEPEFIPVLHGHASLWYENNNSPILAVKHACLAGNLSQAARIIEDAGGWEIILFGGIPLFRQFIESLPVEDLAKFPRVEIARIYYLIKNGEILQARRYINRLMEANRQSLEGNEPVLPSLSRDVTLVGVMLDICEDNVTNQKEFEKITRISEKLSDSDSAGHSIVSACSAVAALTIGNFEQALNLATHCCRRMREINSMFGLCYALMHQGRAFLYLGQFREAIAVFRDVLEMTEENFGSESNLKAFAEILISTVLYIMDQETPGPEFHLEALGEMEHYDGWFDIYAAGYSIVASITYTQQGLGAIQDVLQRGRQMAARRSLPRLVGLLDAHEYLFLVRSGAVEQARMYASSKKIAFRLDGKQRVPMDWWKDHLAGMADGLVTLADGDHKGAWAISSTLVDVARAGGNMWHEMEAGLLMALAQHVAKRDDLAFKSLSRTLDTAVAEGAYRIFMNFGKPLEALMLNYYRRRHDLQLSSLTSSFVRNCLSHFNKIPCPAHGGRPETSPLSLREQEILKEIALGFSNKDVARMLDMTENTVKFHLKNIFKKLEVDNRIRAISVGRELKLIS